MNKLQAALAVVSIASISAFSAPVSITVFDGENDNYKYADSWYKTTNEDQEVSNGCVTGQKWDLEAFTLDKTTLSLIGGYDFKKGVDGFTSGDIFIDVTGNAKYGASLPSQGFDANKNVKNKNGWDYVLDLNMSSLTYDVYKIDTNSIVTTSFYNSNSDATPWRYASGGTFVTSGIIGYSTNLLDNSVLGYTGGINKKHNQVSVDLSFLGNTNFTAHYTMQCGNDNIIGKGTVKVPEPAAMSLLGSGFLLLAMFFRKRKV